MRQKFCIAAIIVLAILQETTCDQDNKCDPIKVFTCSQDLAELKTVNLLDTAYDEATLDKLCKPFDCFKYLVEHCHVPDLLQLKSDNKVMQHMDEICTKGSELRADIIAFAPCVKEYKGILETCRPKGLEDLASFKPDKTHCCLYFKFVGCTETSVKQKCNPRAINMFKRITIPSMMGQQVESCEDFRRDCLVSAVGSDVYRQYQDHKGNLTQGLLENKEELARKAQQYFHEYQKIKPKGNEANKIQLANIVTIATIGLAILL